MSLPTRSHGSGIDVRRVLCRTYLFEAVPPEALEPLLAHVTVRTFERGEHVFAVGDPATHLHVVAEGRLKELLPTPEGDEFVFEVLQAGGTCGEPGLFAREGVRVASLVALEPSVIVNIEKHELVAFLFRHPPAMRRMLEGLAGQVRSMAEDMGALAFATIRDRFVLKLLEIAERTDDGLRIDLGVSQATLAAMIGATRENVNRTLKALAASGHVLMRGTDIVIPDPDRMRQMVKGGHIDLYRRNRRPTR